MLWVQNRKHFKMVHVPRDSNMADLNTKPLGGQRIRYLMNLIGYWHSEDQKRVVDLLTAYGVDIKGSFKTVEICLQVSCWAGQLCLPVSGWKGQLSLSVSGWTGAFQAQEKEELEVWVWV